MINFNFEVELDLKDSNKIQKWISSTILNEGKKEGEINYIFCADDYLHKINVEFLKHDYLTDIISFDYNVGNELHGDIYISVDRVKENAEVFHVPFDNELLRVMVHGILHFCGYKDKLPDEKLEMRKKEDFYIKAFS